MITENKEFLAAFIIDSLKRIDKLRYLENIINIDFIDSTIDYIEDAICYSLTSNISLHDEISDLIAFSYFDDVNSFVNDLINKYYGC